MKINHNNLSVNIVDSWDENVERQRTYYTVEISNGKYIDVVCVDQELVYVFQIRNRHTIYDRTGKSYAGKAENEEKIMEMIWNFHVTQKNKKAV